MMFRHGLHRPDRCCILCHKAALLDIEGPVVMGASDVPWRKSTREHHDPGPSRKMAGILRLVDTGDGRW